MPDSTTSLGDTLEVFSSSIEEFVTSLAKGISDAQQAMDQNSIKTQEVLDSDPVASRYGLQATWYQFPRVDLQLKLAVAIAQDQSAPANPSVPIRPTRLIAQPVSASYQTHFNYDAQAASTLSLSIVPVPPQRSVTQVVQPQLTTDKVQAAALGSAAKFATAKDAQGNTIPATKDAQGNLLRFDMNFNGAAGSWYVLQYAPSNSAWKAVVVVVDDGTGSVRIISTL
jgi:hypothetical protein